MFTNRYGVAVRPPKRQETSSPDTIVLRNESFGLAIDCETATAHWHGERIDYDHALMVTMASWDSGDTRPEAGPGGWRLESVVDQHSVSGIRLGCDAVVGYESIVQPTCRVGIAPLGRIDKAKCPGEEECRKAVSK